MKTVSVSGEVQGFGVGDMLFAVSQSDSLIPLKIVRIDVCGLVIAYHTEPAVTLNESDQDEYQRVMKKLLTTTGVCLCLQNTFLFKTRDMAVNEAIKRISVERTRLSYELAKLDVKRQALQAKPYLVLHEGSQSCIEFSVRDGCGQPGEVVFRMVRTDETERLWSLHVITNGEMDPLPLTRHQYRTDLIERLQAGIYDKFLPESVSQVLSKNA